MSNLRVWWCPQVSAKIPDFYIEVDSVREGVKIMDVLADYDLYQLRSRIKPDYSNMGGLEMMNSDDEWESWHDDKAETDDPREYLEMVDSGEIDGGES